MTGSRGAVAVACLVLAMAPVLAQSAAPPAAAAEPAPRPVRSAYWGSVLFDLYQDRSFPALTGLMAAQHFARLTVHADEAEVLRGGLLLDYGMDIEAAAIFDGLIQRTTMASVRDRAWYQLARLRHHKGLNEQAEQALQRIGPALPAELHDARLLLQGQLQLLRGDHAAASASLAAMPMRSPLAPFARFNLGVARIQAGASTEGLAMLQAVGTMPASSEELRGLRDKANLALAFHALRDNEAAAALTALERIRLEGPQSHAALLAFGWASLQQKEPKRALVALRELSGRSLRDAPVLEAQIAEAHALAEAGVPGAAVQAYEKALAFYSEEDRRLEEARAAIRSGAWAAAVLGPQTPRRWEQPASPQVDAQLPQAAILAPLVAQHALQQALKTLGDLRLAQANLADGAERLLIFDDMLAQRQAGYEQRAPQVRDQSARVDPGLGQQRLAQLQHEWQQAASEANGQAHATADEQVLRQRIDSARAALADLEPGERDAAADRLRLAEGSLLWHWAREHHARHQQAGSALQDLATQGAIARQRLQALERAQKEEPERLRALAARISELRTRIAATAPVVAALAAEQQGQAQQMAEAQLDKHRERLAGYAEQARWSVAQLVDRARMAGGPDVQR